MAKRSNGEGSIFKRNINGKEYWGVQINLGSDENGKRIRKTFNCQSESQAVQIKNEHLAKLLKGEIVSPNQIFFKDWLQEYLVKYKKLQVRQSTFDKYAMLAKNHIYDEIFANKQIQKITTKDIQNLISLKSKKYASKTTREIHLVISMAFDQALKEELVFKNPAKNVSLPRIVEKSVEPLTDEEILHLLAVTKNHERLNRMYMPILLALTSGVRRGELLALQNKNVLIESNCIRILQSYVKTSIGNIIQEPKTKASIRKISVPAGIMKELQKYMNDNPSPEYVFTQLRDDTKPISPRHFSTMFEILCTDAKLKTKRFHDLRHTYASQLLTLNVHMKVVQAQGGWSDIRTCMNRYSHLTGGLQAEAADKLNTKFKGLF